MKFRNDTDKVRMVQIPEPQGKSRWVSFKPNEIKDLPQSLGKLYNLTPVEALESKAGPVVVETKVLKKKVVPSEKEILIKIKGVNEEIAEAILMRFGSIASAVEAGVKGLMRVPAIGKGRAKKIISSLS